ncbi:trypsin beta-like [Drosophila eugracilis]|uniref:trypsin beta-like n=1 Tax=Drosophila eugracilis TaxID=29029 RepID=UPI001BD9C8CC|nr:trypsin beta-like [Drosophila eugracilis]
MYFKCLIFLSIATLVSAGRIPGPEERIIGGHSIPIEYVPWQVSLQGKETHNCGGAIYSDRAIVTAAHCIFEIRVEGLSIRAGSSHWSKGGQLVNVLKAVYHPLYDNKTFFNDIGVLILESPLKFNNHVQKIALADKSPVGGTMSLVSGWGYTREDAAYSWPTLQGVHVAILNHTECENAYIKSKITEDMICADGIGRDSCRTDSGGPLVSIRDRNLIGIVSWGEGCGRNPGVYADVAFFRDWINDKIEEYITYTDNK